MTKYAVIKENIVDNLIIANTLEDAELVTNANCIEYTDENPACIGWTWDGTNFIPPLVEEPIEDPA